MLAVGLIKSLAGLSEKTPCAVMETLIHGSPKRAFGGSEEGLSFGLLSFNPCDPEDQSEDFLQQYIQGNLSIAYARAGRWEDAMSALNEVLSPTEHLATMTELLSIATKQKHPDRQNQLAELIDAEIKRFDKSDAETHSAILYEVLSDWPPGHALPEPLTCFVFDLKEELVRGFQELLHEIDEIDEIDLQCIEDSPSSFDICQDAAVWIGEFSNLATYVRDHDSLLYREVLESLLHYIRELNRRWPAIDKLMIKEDEVYKLYDIENSEDPPDMEEAGDFLGDLVDAEDANDHLLLIAQSLSLCLVEHRAFFCLSPEYISDVTGCIVRSLPVELDPQSPEIFEAIKAYGMCAGSCLQFPESNAASYNAFDTIGSIDSLIAAEASQDETLEVRIRVRTYLLQGVVASLRECPTPIISDRLTHHYEALLRDLGSWCTGANELTNAEDEAVFNDIAASAAEALGMFSNCLGITGDAAEHKHQARVYAEKSASLFGADPSDSVGQGPISMLMRLSLDPDLKLTQQELLDLIEKILFVRMFPVELGLAGYGAIYTDLRMEFISLCASLGKIEKALGAYCHLVPSLTDQEQFLATRKFAEGLSRAEVEFELPDFS